MPVTSPGEMTSHATYTISVERAVDPVVRGRLHEEFLRMFLANPLVRPGAITVLGSPVDLAAVKGLGPTGDYVLGSAGEQ